MPPRTFHGEVVVSKVSWLRYYTQDGYQRVLKHPKRYYSLNTAPDGKQGYFCTKAQFDSFDVPDTSIPETQSDRDRWAKELREEEHIRLGYNW